MSIESSNLMSKKLVSIVEIGFHARAQRTKIKKETIKQKLAFFVESVKSTELNWPENLLHLQWK